MDIRKYYSIPLVKQLYREIIFEEKLERADRIEDTAIGASTVLAGSEVMTDVTDNLRRRG